MTIYNRNLVPDFPTSLWVSIASVFISAIALAVAIITNYIEEIQ